MNYSVLMSVYDKEKPEFLRESMQSIADQTLPTNDFVLVCDGPLNRQLDAVIAQMQRYFGEILRVVRLPENRGLGHALNQGMGYCKNEIIARMDSDDIAYPDRCEKELQCMVQNNADFLSAGVEEVTDAAEYTGLMRLPPRTHEEIMEFAKKRNPINHPCAMYKKSAVLAAGGYQEFYLLEDYYLWIRMLQNGSKAYNIQQPLLRMRAGSRMYRRRSGWKYAVAQIRLFRFMKDRGFIGRGSYLASCTVRTLSAAAPNWLREGLFKIMLRKPAEKSVACPAAGAGENVRRKI